ncbi:MAG: hypothetical protein HZB80_07165 [Deltaproteobacteria bacterium]|nr:hypothetical protein [Deltaproteobacteria bacterium]
MLLHGEEKAVFGDKGYADSETKTKYRARGVFYGIPVCRSTGGWIKQRGIEPALK